MTMIDGGNDEGMFAQAAEAGDLDDAGHVHSVNVTNCWPGEVELEGIYGPLSEEQDARASALYHASSVLRKRGPMGTETPPSIEDLLAVAGWILSGDEQ